MDANGLKFWMLSEAQDWPLPPLTAAPNESSLASAVAAGDQDIILLTPLPAGAPSYVSIDFEVMIVNGVDSTGLQLSVTRGALGTIAATHPPGARVLGPTGILRTAVDATDTDFTIVAGAHPPTTPHPTTTPPPATTAPPALVPAVGLAPGDSLQIGDEVVSVTAVDSTGLVISVTRGVFGTTPAAYSGATPLFAFITSNTLYYCATSKRLQLLSMRLGNPPLESFAEATRLVNTVPMARDAFGNYARWDFSRRQVVAGGSGPGEVPIYSAPGGQNISDLALGNDGILYIAAGTNLILVDRRGRWPDFTLPGNGFTFWRLAALPDAGVLALDPNKPQLGKIIGTPLQTAPADTPDPGILRSCRQNPTPPQIAATYALPATESYVGLSTADDQFLLLSWQASSPANTQSFLRIFDFDAGLGTPWMMSGIRWPYSLAWLGDSKAAVLATGLNEALIFNLAEVGATLLPSGDTYVLTGINSGPFAHTLNQPPYYSAGSPLLAPVRLGTTATASLSLLTLDPGAHAITAFYTGDANNPAAPSAQLVQTVAAAATTVLLSSSQNTSMTGQTVTFTATVTSTGATGNVQFLDGEVVLGTESLSSGSAALAVSTFTAGAHTITARYLGDGTHAADHSAALVQTVSADAFPVQLTSSLNPSVEGQTVTFTASVTPASASGAVQFLDAAQLQPLLPLSLNSLAGYGSTDPRSPKIIDSGVPLGIWHRLFIEAILPPRCSVVVWLTAAESPAGIAAPTASWYPHAFGDVDMTALPDQTPRAIWLSTPSEVPFANPLLGETPPLLNRRGLFMVLIQRAGRAVRNLSGRFLGIRVELYGDRRNTPEIAALRAWGSRFSYVRNYLPELYRENKFGPDADAVRASTRHDFFERFVNIFEAQLTRIEDRIANSYLLTRPEVTPDDALDWLGSWVGLSPAGYPADRRRDRLLAASDLHRQRGTVPGITLALDIATNGLCTRGAVIVVEDFRLRHIFATILGANLAIHDDPLLPGYSPSSNSFVGGTLFLGDPQNQAEVLALFSSDLPSSSADRTTVQQFFDSLAHRLTIFIHDQVETVDINLVQRIVDHEKPAHVLATIRLATQPFMVGLASLLGVDTYLAPTPPRDPVVLGTSQIGRYNLVIQAPSLDPRLET